MSNTPHELVHEFPELTGKMQELKASDERFAQLYDRYHEVNRAIHRAETDIEPVGDDYMETLRRHRMVLKDELYGMLTK